MPHLRLLGHLELVDDGAVVARDRKPVLVLAAVALTPKGWLHRDDVGRLLWPDRPSSRARASVRQALHSLRSWCGSDCLVIDDDRLSLHPALSVDVVEVEEALDQRDYERALDLYDGRLLESMTKALSRQLASDVEARGARLTTRLKEAFEVLVGDRLSTGRYDEAEALAARLARMEPMDERAQLLFIETLTACGKPGEAVAAFRAHETLLERELGDRPSDRLRQTAEQARQALVDGRASAAVGSASGPGTLRAGSRVGAVSLVLAAASVAVLALVVVAERRASPGLPAWAAGRMVAVGDSGAFLLEPGRDELALVDSARASAEVSPRVLIPGPTGSESRSTVLGVRSRPGAAPDIVRRDADGRWSLFWDGGGDDVVDVLSPDGHFALVISEDTTRAEYRRSLLRIEVETGDAHVLLRPPWTPLDADWSPDGRWIVTSASYASGPDSVHVLRPDGAREVSWSAGGAAVQQSRFCGTRRLMVGAAELGELVSFRLVDPWSGEQRPLDALGDASFVACSPDGAYAMAFRRGEPEVGIWEIESGQRVHSMDTPYGLRYVTWLPDSVSLPVEVSARAAEPSVHWGGRVDLAVDVADARGADWSGDVEWRSLDPSVLRISHGQAVGAGPGLGRVVAVAHGWLADTVRIEVTDVPGPDVWFVDDFSSFASSGEWHLLGDGPPVPSRTEDGPALRLAGNGQYADGMISARSFPSATGLTVSVDFRLELTRRDRQSVTLCLTDARPPDEGDVSWYMSWERDVQVCARYPGGELVRFRDDRVRLTTLRTSVEYETTELPTSTWARLSLQLSPDGRLGAGVNDRALGVFPRRVDVPEESRLRVAVFGHAVDTRLLARNLVVWRGERLHFGPAGEG